jgi:hypothetical protein
MDVFRVRDQLIEDYCDSTGSFVDIRGKAIRELVGDRVARGHQWPVPWLSLNPNFASDETILDLVAEGLLQSECERIFRLKDRSYERSVLRLHQDQREAIETACGAIAGSVGCPLAGRRDHQACVQPRSRCPGLSS